MSLPFTHNAVAISLLNESIDIHSKRAGSLEWVRKTSSVFRLQASSEGVAELFEQQNVPPLFKALLALLKPVQCCPHDLLETELSLTLAEVVASLDAESTYPQRPV